MNAIVQNLHVLGRHRSALVGKFKMKSCVLSRLWHANRRVPRKIRGFRSIGRRALRATPSVSAT